MEKNDNFKSELATQYTILIKASEKKEQKRYIAIIIILASTLISVLISVFFSYKAYEFSTNLENNIEETTDTIYQTLSIKYNGSNTLNLSNIGNGYKLNTPRSVEITNDGTEEIVFDLKLTSISSSLLSTNNLVYTLKKDNEESVSKELPLTEKALLSDVKIEPNETITYIINVSFNGVISDGNSSNYYNSKIIVEQKNNKVDLLN